MITLKRAYEPASRADGTRFLVERLWPRGISKAKLKVDAWAEEVGPSTELRRWFGHDPDGMGRAPSSATLVQLRSRPRAWRPVVDGCQAQEAVTLVYSSHDTQHSNARALQEYFAKEVTPTGDIQAVRHAPVCSLSTSDKLMSGIPRPGSVRLVVADVDGTLSTPEKVLTPRARKVVQRIIDAGIAFTVTSGRPPLGMKALIADLQLRDPITRIQWWAGRATRSLSDSRTYDPPRGSASRHRHIDKEHAGRMGLRRPGLVCKVAPRPSRGS